MRRLLAALALTAFVAACGDSTSPKKSPVGTWSLSTLDGAAPPLVVASSSDSTLYLTGSTLTIEQSGSFTESIGLRLTWQSGDSTFQQVDAGKWTMSGTTITFNVIGATPSDNFSYTGSFQDSTIVEPGSNVWVYRRQ